MAARKKRPVLYEVVNRSRRRRTRPASRPVDQSPPATVDVAEPLSDPPDSAPATSAEQPADAAFMQIIDGRVYLTLGWWHIVAAGAILIAVGVGLFQAGLRSATPPTSDTAEEAFLDEGYEATPAAADSTAVVDPNQRAGSGAIVTPTPQPPARSAEPVRPALRADTHADTSALPSIDSLAGGDYRVVIQYFRSRDLDVARKARNFLRSNGVSCEVFAGHGDYMLIANDTFASDSAARGLVRRIRELGDEYLRGGGGYDFGGAEPRRF